MHKIIYIILGWLGLLDWQKEDRERARMEKKFGDCQPCWMGCCSGSPDHLLDEEKYEENLTAQCEGCSRTQPMSQLTEFDSDGELYWCKDREICKTCAILHAVWGGEEIQVVYRGEDLRIALEGLSKVLDQVEIGLTTVQREVLGYIPSISGDNLHHVGRPVLGFRMHIWVLQDYVTNLTLMFTE